MLLSVDEAISHTVMVEVELSRFTVDLDHLLPVGRLNGLEVLNQFELVGESSANHQSVLTVLVVRADFLRDDSAVVLVQSHTLNKTVHLFALRVEVDFTFFVEDSLGAVLDTFSELLLINDKFW